MKQWIEQGKAVLGIELGSTRIKAVLIGPDHAPIASGDHTWENRFEKGVWTYHLEDVWSGIQTAYANLAADVKAKYGAQLTRLGGFGVSAMMHGYLPFDKDGKQLAEFRTWRNTMTGEAAAELTALLGFNIPQRWSIAHLYQAVLKGEDHLPALHHLTTLAGYVHWRLTGKKVLGVGEASGMFPIDSDKCDYDQRMIDLVDAKIAEKGYAWRLREILPAVLNAGEDAGVITPQGAKLLDPTGMLEAGAVAAPPEGDAGTGMTATNAVAVRTGNVSAGTSVFAMIVLEKPLSKVYPEIDMVTTPTGKPVAMVHCNNCTSDINAWVNLLSEFAGAIGADVNKGNLYTLLFNKAMEGEKDCGGLMANNYFSGEGVTDLDEGRPFFARTPNARFTLANFMRAHLMSALATLKIGLDILTETEQVKIDKLYGHGGFFKTPKVGQTMLSAAVQAPVSVMETAGEGGPYGMALLAAYLINKEENETLEDYLDNKVFAGARTVTLMADEADVQGFNRYLETYVRSLEMEKAAIRALKEEE